eukprot:gnl/MRDRNA2_/MRDRNA2_21967_c0_seq1.p1 gnl/MRDRNA2_/MRDRNA2_21967_c0~~gnl/MRDRNA2_/MRDRNA2_21967_c0_seq1.p1  ORF type:complete len:225 (-),score=39.68 gnl/MRDRNA2_/MRDRNA2_21967_c0_seq1:53-652(-)
MKTSTSNASNCSRQLSGSSDSISKVGCIGDNSNSLELAHSLWGFAEKEAGAWPRMVTPLWPSVHELLRRLRWVAGQRETQCAKDACEAAVDSDFEKHVLLGLLELVEDWLSRVGIRAQEDIEDKDCQRIWRDEHCVWVTLRGFCVGALEVLKGTPIDHLELQRLVPQETPALHMDALPIILQLLHSYQAYLGSIEKQPR